jgi:excisionase family DNA binding protein
MQTEKAEGLNIRQAAKFIGVSPPTFVKLLPTIPHRRIGKRVLVSRSTLSKWLEGEPNEK